MDAFDPITIQRGAKCVLIGAQNLGKTTLILSLLPMLGLRRVHVQTNDEYAIPRYEAQGYDIVDEYNESACDAIVLDYSSCHEELQTDKFRRLMKQNMATVFITMVYGMSHEYEFDYAFLFRSSSINNQRRLFNYCRPGLFRSLEEFGQTLLRETEWIDSNGISRIKAGACLVVSVHQNLIARYPKNDAHNA